MREPDRHLALAADSPTVSQHSRLWTTVLLLGCVVTSIGMSCVLQGKIKLRCGAGFRLYTVYVTNEPPPSA